MENVTSKMSCKNCRRITIHRHIINYSKKKVFGIAIIHKKVQDEYQCIVCSTVNLSLV